MGLSDMLTHASATMNLSTESSTDKVEPSLSYEFARTNQVVLANGVLYVGLQVTLDGLLESQRLADISEEITVEICDKKTFETKLHQEYQFFIGTVAEVANHVNDEVADIEELTNVNNLSFDLLGKDDAAVIRIINAIIAEAINKGASDIHMAEAGAFFAARLRQDGVLTPLIELPITLGPLLLSRIKIMAKLNIAEKRLPQDGRISVDLAGKQVDVRVSIIPSKGGERAVLRILDRHSQVLNLNDLGMSKGLKNNLKQLINKPHGIILVTGPTGSGKTTTLYACLQELDCQAKNIMSIEDPVEYDFPSISQTSVNLGADMTFAKGLRAILRQDPDVILVGEIRDLETAQIAIQASLTGHLVLSTLHTNNAVGAITRLRDMGIPSYLLASSILGILGQRLVKKRCTHCQDQSKKHFDCPICQGEGTWGRLALFESLTMTHTLKQAVHQEAAEQILCTIDVDAYQPFSLDIQEKIRQQQVDSQEALIYEED